MPESSSSVHLNKDVAENNHPLSPLGFEQGLNRSNGPAIIPTSSAPSSRRPFRRRERKKRSAPPIFRKLLWVQQKFPDNYTDASTFLDHLQRNPKLQPYEFWRLVADSTVIVQQVCSVAIFVCCFTGIFQERISPVTVVGWCSAFSILGWITWDIWVGQEQADDAAAYAILPQSLDNGNDDAIQPKIVPAPAPTSDSDDHSSQPHRTSSFRYEELQPDTPTLKHYYDPDSQVSPRNQQRLITIKSAVLIYCAVLGMSPILKSLTKSTTSDSIWALSSWLMVINLLFFDYSGGLGAKFPASLSTNAALMASTVLASRLASTTHVFLLTLFSIQVFGLFPVFRRHLRHISRFYHNILTLTLVLGAGGGLAVTLNVCNWSNVVVGCCLGLITAAVAMGGTSWWLLGLQRWKDDIVGPWDVARPRLSRRWN